jgi:hypothetical protein
MENQTQQTEKGRTGLVERIMRSRLMQKYPITGIIALVASTALGIIGLDYGLGKLNQLLSPDYRSKKEAWEMRFEDARNILLNKLEAGDNVKHYFHRDGSHTWFVESPKYFVRTKYDTKQRTEGNRRITDTHTEEEERRYFKIYVDRDGNGCPDYRFAFEDKGGGKAIIWTYPNKTSGTATCKGARHSFVNLDSFLPNHL